VAAFDVLAHDLLAGDFEENGKSRVLYWRPAKQTRTTLHPEQKTWMTKEQLQDLIDHKYYGADPSQYLQDCWISDEMFDAWRRKHCLKQSPVRFQPRASRTTETPPKQRQSALPRDFVISVCKEKIPGYEKLPTKDLIHRYRDEVAKMKKQGIAVCSVHDSTIKRAVKRQKSRTQ
jgi:hypothetical protein